MECCSEFNFRPLSSCWSAQVHHRSECVSVYFISLCGVIHKSVSLKTAHEAQDQECPAFFH